MRTSTWDQDWVYGLYESSSAADSFVHEAETAGFKKEDFAVLTPDTLQKHRFENVLPEEHHPEWRLAVTGGIIGFLAGNIVGHLIMYFAVSGLSWMSSMLIAMIPGFGGAVAGTFFGIQFTGVDATLNALYEDSGKGKVMVAVKCDSHYPEKTDVLEQLFLKSGVKPIEYPHSHVH